MKLFNLQLTRDELTVLKYLVSGAASPYAADPLKDIYEVGDEEPAHPYEALRELDKKVMALRYGGRRGVDYQCESCHEMSGSYLERGFWRCHSCGYPGQ